MLGYASKLDFMFAYQYLLSQLGSNRLPYISHWQIQFIWQIFSDTVKAMNEVWCYSMAIALCGCCGGPLLSLFCSFGSALWKERLRMETSDFHPSFYTHIRSPLTTKNTDTQRCNAKGVTVQSTMGAYVTPLAR